MRTPLTLALLVLLTTTAYSQPCENLEGAWELVSQKITSSDNVTERSDFKTPSTKILTSTHFAFGRQSDDGQNVTAGGGRYTLENGVYTEIIQYHTTPPLVGTSIRFDCRLENDRWYHTGEIGNLKLEELWQRIR